MDPSGSDAAMTILSTPTSTAPRAAPAGRAARTGLVSIIVPVFNEEDCLDALNRELGEVLARLGRPHEIIFVNDGSTDGSRDIIEALARQNENVTAVNLQRNSGKSAALDAGFRLARGDVIFTMDADLQDDPAEIPRFIEEIEKGSDLVNGWKKSRLDPLNKTMPSKLFNLFTGRVSGLSLHDFNCGFKAYRRAALADLRLYGELHRFIPVLVHWNGFKVTEIPVHHRKRYAGHSKFGARRLVTGAFDLLTVMLTSQYRSRPLHFFGYIALLFGLTGALMLMWLFATSVLGLEELRPRPMLYGSILLVVVSAIFFAAGLVGELIKSFHPDARDYRINSVVSQSSPDADR
jgi:glycosyltransferase involved in cell wall biosynthesis